MFFTSVNQLLFCLFQPRDSGGQNNVVIVKASDFEVFEALAVDSVGTESAKTGTCCHLVYTISLCITL